MHPGVVETSTKPAQLPVQPLQSVAVTVTGPIPKPDISSVVSPVDHAKVYPLAEANPIYAFGLYNLEVAGMTIWEPEVIVLFKVAAPAADLSRVRAVSPRV